MDLVFDLYWSFRSPYSYIVLPRIIELRDKFRVSVDLRIVHPQLSGIRHTSHEWYRCATVLHEGQRPRRRLSRLNSDGRFPIRSNRTRIHGHCEGATPRRRLGRLGIAANDRGRGSIGREVSSLLGMAAFGWDQGTHQPRRLRAQGLIFGARKRDRCSSRWVPSTPRWERSRAPGRGTSGSSRYVYEGEPFFGQHRFDVWLRLKQRGLEPRGNCGAL